MLALAFVSFFFGARSALSAPHISPPWVTSNYCNAPHVNASHYQLPSEGAQLIHLTVMMRHHKVNIRPHRSRPLHHANLTQTLQRTPVALVPNERGINEGIEWDCSHVRQFTYDGGGARLSHSVTTPPDHPFAQQIWAGNCEEGQLTAGGFRDSKIHGKVWRFCLVLYQRRMTRRARTSGSCIMVASAFYAPLILARSAYVQHTSTAQSTWPVVSLLAWIPLLPSARGPHMHNLRGKVSFCISYSVGSDFEFR
jgi:hypothetical protein